MIGRPMRTNETVVECNGIARVSRGITSGVVCALIISLFAVLMATVAWLSWILMSGLLGLPGATFASAVLLLGAAALSARSGRGFADSLVMVGFGSFILLTAALFGIAGYTLIFGE
jgi:hypothetical protein